MNTLIDNTVNYINEFVLSSIDNKAYHLKDILKQSDKAKFIKAMIKEINIHKHRNYWELCRRMEILKDMKPIISIWAFKQKRLPSGELLKHKARLCAHRGQQQWGVNY